VIAGPGSKALLFSLMVAIGGDVAVSRPSWVSYAAQASLAGRTAHFVRGNGGVPDAEELGRAVTSARADGRRIRSVVVTLPDNPTGQLAPAAAVRALCAAAREHDLIIISDEIYRDLVHDPDAPFTSPAALCPERTAITTGLSKNLASSRREICFPAMVFPERGCRERSFFESVGQSNGIGMGH